MFGGLSVEGVRGWVFECFRCLGVWVFGCLWVWVCGGLSVEGFKC